MLSKSRFLYRVLRQHIKDQPRHCPYCGPHSTVTQLRRKKVVLRILKCETCKLIFRWPLETLEEAETYYQAEYAAESPQCQLPVEDELNKLLGASFAGTPLDLSSKLHILQSLQPCGRVLDYGCSWGYGTFQLRQCGFDAVGFEVSKSRACYAREMLGLEVVDDLGELAKFSTGSFDAIFSNHVVEHLVDIRRAFEMMSRLLKSGGLLFHVLPNFTGKTALNGMWIMWIGEEHPIAPTVEFFDKTLPSHAFIDIKFRSSPFDEGLISSVGLEDTSIRTDGDELLVLARKR
jgi:SAM-dependent methyltransferase